MPARFKVKLHANTDQCPAEANHCNLARIVPGGNWRCEEAAHLEWLTRAAVNTGGPPLPIGVAMGMQIIEGLLVSP